MSLIGDWRSGRFSGQFHNEAALEKPRVLQMRVGFSCFAERLEAVNDLILGKAVGLFLDCPIASAFGRNENEKRRIENGKSGD